MAGSSAIDTYMPLCESLLQLQDAADRIFDAITIRVGLQHEQLAKLSARIISAQDKVDSISGTKRATTVYSSAKFPRVDPSVFDFVPLFEGTKEQSQSKPSADVVSLKTCHWQSQEEGTLELFQFFSETSHEYWLKDHKHKYGVGKVPPGVKSVADVLLFNSSELPYHKFRIVDNLAGAGHLQNEEELEVKPAALPVAPQSVLVGDVLPRPGADEYGFRPVLRQVPSFSLPSVLPDLPMVAEISWSGMSGGGDQLSSIAPSASHGGLFSPRSNNSIMPRFDSGSVSTRFDPASASRRLDALSSSNSLDPDAVSRQSDFASVNGSFHQRGPPSQVMPFFGVNPRYQDRNLQSAKSASGESSSDSARSISSVPSSTHQSIAVDTRKDLAPPPPVPPPPPRPPSLPSPARVAYVQTKSSDQQPLPPIDSQRMALMASIRNSGLDLLRKTGKSESSNSFPATSSTQAIGRPEVEALEKSMPADVKKPVNVMAEMARSLTLRRLSMRGAAHDQGAMRSESHKTPPIEEHESDESLNFSTKEKYSNLHAMITRRSEEQSDDDDWE